MRFEALAKPRVAMEDERTASKEAQPLFAAEALITMQRITMAQGPASAAWKPGFC